MKNIKYLFLVAAGFVASCTAEYDRIFDQSAAERMSATLEEYKKILTSAPNGWTMDYYAEYPENRTGGYVYTVSFDANGFTTMASETDVTESGGVVTAKRVTSTYDLIADQGPVLTFDTYNRLLHQFTEPKGSGDIDGDAGDYEFVFMEVSADKIVMKGKKNENIITLKALPAAADWDEYIGDAINMDIDNYYPIFTVTKNGIATCVVRQDSDRRLKFMDGNDEEISRMSIIPTPDGFHLYEPVEEYGITFDEFLWDATEQVFKSPDGSVVLSGSFPAVYAPYPDFLKAFRLTHVNYNGTTMTRNVTAVEKKYNKSYTVTNFGESPYTGYNVTATYNRETGQFAFYPQSTGYTSSYGDIDLVHLTSMSSSGISISTDTEISYVGNMSYNGSGKMVLTFNSSAVGATIGICFLDRYFWQNCVWTQMVWTEL